MTYKLTSCEMVFTPGVIKWIVEGVAPFNKSKAVNILRETYKVPDKACKKIIKGQYDVQGDCVIVTV